MQELSNQYEQEAVLHYCINRKLSRPKTNIVTALLFLLLMEVLIVVLSFGFNYLLVWFEIFLPYSTVYLFVTVIVLSINIKRMVVLSIELYQHYAPDETRRKCTLKPSCSEYTILALKKHGIFKGLYKSYVRLFKTCVGTIYREDYP